MANPEHLEILKQGVGVWNEWRKENPETTPDLKRANLHRANLNGANLRNADLREANLSEATLIESDLVGTKLEKANLTGASLRDAIISRARLNILQRQKSKRMKEGGKIAGFIQSHLDGAKLNDVDLSGAKLNGMDLRDVDLSKVNLDGAKLVMVDLSGANLREASLRDADLYSADLTRADLTGALLNKASSNVPQPRGTLGGRSTTFHKSYNAADIRGVNFNGAILNGVDLSGMNLEKANLAGANLTYASLVGINLTNMDFREAILRNADLSYTILVGTIFEKADLTGCRVHGVAAWNTILEGAIQKDLVISRVSEPQITVDDLRVAQFIYLLMDNEQIRYVIDSVTAKAVLILGRFTDERKPVLDALREELRQRDYLPILFDFSRPVEKDFTETILTLAGMSKFIIADITNPKSSPLELHATIPNFMTPFVPIIQEGESPFSMFKDLWGKHNWVIDLLEYDSVDTLIKVIEPAIISPALQKSEELILLKAKDLVKRRASDYLMDVE